MIFCDSLLIRRVEELYLSRMQQEISSRISCVFFEDQGMGYETPYPEPPPRTPHGNYRMISRNNLSMKINKFAFKRSIISISKYPESFVKIEFVDLKKINNYCIVWVWNPRFRFRDNSAPNKLGPGQTRPLTKSAPNKLGLHIFGDQIRPLQTRPPIEIWFRRLASFIIHANHWLYTLVPIKNVCR